MPDQLSFDDGDEDGDEHEGNGRDPLDVPAFERRHRHPHETERDASESVDNVALAWECLKLYAKHRGGLIDDELGPLSGSPEHKHESYRRRGSDLRPLGLIDWLRDDAGKVVKRRTNEGDGAPAGVCVITDKGLEVLRSGVMPERPKPVKDRPVPVGTPVQVLALVLMPVGADEYRLALPPGAKVEYTNVVQDARLVGSAERLGRRLFVKVGASERQG